MTIEYNNFKLFHKNNIFIINTETMEYNTKILKNVGFNTQKNQIQQQKVLTYQNLNNKQKRI